ncbi:MAG: carboxypeptidase regulatory-like domain-containing protein, partial [Nitrospirae bacterium]|nr:carboxypeptidase regulatory-like domain-containing protein [Nitrospirota bacterium]
MKQSLVLRNKYIVVAAFFVLVLSMLLGCSGSTGPQGPAGASGTSAGGTGTVSGTVTSSSGAVLSGITVAAYLSTGGTTAKALADPNQNYQRAKAHSSTDTPVATATTDSSGKYSLTLAQGVYDIVFTDPKGAYTLGSMSNYSVTGGGSYTVSAGLGASVSVNTASAAAPSVTVTNNGNTVGSSSSATNPLNLKGTSEVGYGATVTLVAQATSSLSNATLSYAWKSSYPSNPGGTNKTLVVG